MQTRKASKLISLLKVCVFVTFASAACNVYAEYYLVYPTPGFECPDCYAPPPEWRPYHVRHHAYAKHHRCRYARNYAYDVRVIVPLCPPPPCMSCYPRQRSHEFVEFNTNPDAYGHGRYVINEIDTNDPDMSTGDDDASVHPDMDIDY